MELCCNGAQCCVSAWHLKQLGLCVSVGICIWIGPMPRMADKWLCVHYHPCPSAPSQRHSQSPAGVLKTARASWVRIRRVLGDLSVPSSSDDNSGQWAAHREMLCSAEWKPSGLFALQFELCEGLLELCTEAAVSRCTWGDRVGNSPVNFNTSMHRRSHSLGEEGGKGLGLDACSIKCEKRTVSALLSKWSCISMLLNTCKVKGQTEVVLPTLFSFSTWSEKHGR